MGVNEYLINYDKKKFKYKKKYKFMVKKFKFKIVEPLYLLTREL